ncbi:MAG: hypothetical protein B7Y11_13710 [Sphingobacteriia bacterium 24-36-13]|nr:MAG: hypothetical protein B7Y11_13710 [Sphingobacteriia bacterium 24-36-13]
MIKAIHNSTEKYSYYLGIGSKFRGISFSIMFDNPTDCAADEDYFLFQIVFIWVTFYLTINYKKQ